MTSGASDRRMDGRDPPLDFPYYRSTALRHPKQPLIRVGPEHSGPALSHLRPGEMCDDLTSEGPIGERIAVSGRLLDSDGHPIADSLIEVWQANAAGRYRHRNDRWPARLDPGFQGGGRTVTDSEGRYEFLTIKPGPYPWGNHHNAWRPAHIHFSVMGRAFDERLVTQMYFPGDPLFPHDPIFNSVRDSKLRELMVSRFSIDRSQDDWALAYEFDIVVDRLPFE
jgi:protocatechuate 3,4-dioxygenase, beta subunit